MQNLNIARIITHQILDFSNAKSGYTSWNCTVHMHNTLTMHAHSQHWYYLTCTEVYNCDLLVNFWLMNTSLWVALTLKNQSIVGTVLITFLAYPIALCNACMCQLYTHTSYRICQRKWRSLPHQTQQQWCPLHFREQVCVLLPQGSPSRGIFRHRSAESQGERQTHPAGTLTAEGGDS